MKSKVRSAIKHWWGPRCNVYNPDCAVCQAWAEYDDCWRGDL